MVKSPLLWFLVILFCIALTTALSPEEKILGANARVVYLHGAWVWTALLVFLAAAITGAVGLLLRIPLFNHWSRALGRSGLFFWITYLPLSMWAMQTSWNGLFLSEPRWRLAVISTISGLLVQMGVSLLEDSRWASAANIVYMLAVGIALANTENVMHPPSPITSSDATSIQLSFTILLVLTLLAAWQFSRFLFRFEQSTSRA